MHKTLLDDFYSIPASARWKVKLFSILIVTSTLLFSIACIYLAQEVVQEFHWPHWSFIVLSVSILTAITLITANAITERWRKAYQHALSITALNDEPTHLIKLKQPN